MRTLGSSDGRRQRRGEQDREGSAIRHIQEL